jgi:hypothetical protein
MSTVEGVQHEEVQVAAGLAAARKMDLGPFD